MKRIEQLDIVRGVALVGIFIVNICAFVFLDVKGITPEWQQIGRTIKEAFFVAKFYPIFAMLFGAGVYLFLRNARAKGYNANRLFLRRLAALLVFGLLHAMMWNGDVLRSYAVSGVIVLACSYMSEKWLKRVALALFLVVQVGLMGIYPVVEALMVSPTEMTAMESSGNMPIPEAQSFMMEQLSNFMMSALGSVLVLSYMLIGYVAMQQQWLERGTAFWRKRMMWLLPVSVPFAIALLIVNLVRKPEGVPLDYTLSTLNSLVALPLVFLYVCAIVTYADRLRWFIPLGRMAFTNYLTQTLLFFCLAKGLQFSTIHYELTSFGMVAVVIVIQRYFSAWWLSRYAYGPLEFVWRKWTYGWKWSNEKVA